eukprot:GHVR01036065.1.p1 GENE.GHVR01036065.1~~GHVR01036065.1.p1  ORF type:complete len:338 (+),score=97.48 GHVR01036065.1:24-1037(+)
MDSCHRSTGFQFQSTRQGTLCPHCRNVTCVIYDNQTGDEICRKTGRVLQERMLCEEQEWRTFSNESNTGADMNRTGGPNDVWLDDGVQGTTVAGGDRRFAQTHDAATSGSAKDRQIKSAFRQFFEVCKYFHAAESTVERGKEMIKALSDCDKLNRRANKRNMVAILYLSCAEDGRKRTLKELCNAGGDLESNDLGQTVKKLQKLLPRRGYGSCQSAADLMPKFCDKLDLSAELRSVCEDVVRAAESKLHKARKPTTLAGAVLMFVSREVFNVPLPMHDVMRVVQAAASTIEVALKDLNEIGIQELLPKWNNNNKKLPPPPQSELTDALHVIQNPRLR